MKLETAKSLHDIATSCARIESYMQDVSIEAYRDNEALQFIVERLLMTVGEAMSRVARSDPDVATNIAGHQRIISLRNRIVHEYDEIDDDILFDIAVSRIPELRQMAEDLLDLAR